MNTLFHGGSAGRHLRFGLASLVLFVAATVSCLLIGVLGSVHHVRLDATATRQFTLSERTRQALDKTDSPTTIVVSADLSTLDRAARRRMADLLDELRHACPHVRSAWIDTSSATAQADLGRLLASIAEPFNDALAEQRAALRAAADAAAESADGLRAVSDALKALADAGAAPLAAGRTSPRDQAGLVRALASSLDSAAGAIRAAADHSIAGVTLPAVDSARDAALDPLDKAARAADAVADYAGALLAERPADVVASAARELRDLAAAQRDDAARAADALSRLKRLDPLIVARVLEHTSAVLVTSARGTVAIDFATLFPEASGLKTRSTTDTLFAGEQMIATALTSLTSPVSPVAVFVHAQSASLLDDRGEPTAAARAAFARLFDRMRLTTTTPAEWAVMSRPSRPDLAPLDPRGDRPVVWIVLPAPARTSAMREPNVQADRATRVRALAQAVDTLIAAGEHVLLCIEPSDLPSLGEADPIAQAVAPLGLRIDSARPILRSESSPQGRLIWTFQSPTAVGSDHPIAHAVAGLNIVLPWATPIEPAPAEGARAWPILTLDRKAGAWGEAQWFSLRDVVARGLARPLSPMLLSDPPAPDPAHDAILPVASPGFILAAAAERPRGATIPAPRRSQERSPQRAVIVSSPEWLHDGYSQAWEEVSGRRVLLFPGNLELFDAAIAWLACLDDRIAPGPHALAVPTIRPIPEATLRMLRVLLIAGLPALVLIAGAMLRLLRG